MLVNLSAESAVIVRCYSRSQALTQHTLMAVRSLSLSPSILFPVIILLGILLTPVSATCQGCSPPTLVIRVRTRLLAPTIARSLTCHRTCAKRYPLLLLRNSHSRPPPSFAVLSAYRKHKLRNANPSGSSPLSRSGLLRMNRRSCAKYLRRSFPLALAGILVSKGDTYQSWDRL
jgi:hypothetical protein